MIKLTEYWDDPSLRQPVWIASWQVVALRKFKEGTRIILPMQMIEVTEPPGDVAVMVGARRR